MVNEAKKAYRHMQGVQMEGSPQCAWRNQEFGVNYWEIYSQVLGWPEIRFFLVLSAIKGCSSRQIYFFLVFTKDKIECKMYMDTPKGFIFTE